MSDDSTFERVLASLNDAMLDDVHWPATSALIDEFCGLKGNTLMVGEGPTDDKRVLYVGLYSRGQRRHDLEREYLETYHRHDECVPRVRQLPEGCLIHITDAYTAEELKTSPAYNEMFPRANQQDSLVVRLDGSDGSHVLWGVGDPVARHGWGASQVSLIEKMLPHIRQFVRVRQALVRAGAGATTATALLDSPRMGVVHLDRRGRIVEANDRAGGILRQRDGLLDESGMLRARAPHDELPFERLLADALPTSGTVAVSGSMPLHRSSGSSPFVVHVKPVNVPQPDYGARHVAALVLIAEPGRHCHVDPALVSTTLELTPSESQVAVWLAAGKSVHEMAKATGRTKHAIYWHLKQIYQKRSISRQADLVRLVLSLDDLG